MVDTSWKGNKKALKTMGVLLIPAFVYGLFSILSRSGGASYIYLIGFLCISGLLGFYGMKWCSKKSSVNKRLTAVLIWSNLIAWIVPVVGIFIAFATLGIGNGNHKNNKKYLPLPSVGIILSILNVVIGIVVK